MTPRHRGGRFARRRREDVPTPPDWLMPAEHVAGLLTVVFHSAPAGVAVVDRKGRVLAANPALAAMTGHDVADLLGALWRTTLHRDDWALVAELARLVEAQGSATHPVAARLVRRDGAALWVLISLTLALDETGRPRYTDRRGRPRYYLLMVTDISEQKRVEAELAARSGRDPLTGLANRSLLLEHLALSIRGLGRQPGSVTVLFFDLDRFKVINDSLGHAAGDLLLQAVADRLVDAFRPEDLVARLGGDEFVVTMTVHGHEPARDVIAAADRISDALLRPIPVEGRDLVVSASIGIASTDDPDALPEVLLRDADTAMYLAKQRGGRRCELFDEVLRTTVVDRLELEQDLRDAIDQGALTVAYQPIVRLADGVVVAAEALVRWQHRQRGSLLPDAFIPLAEETGLIRSLDRLVLERACAQAAVWHQRAGAGAPAVRVNLSGHEFADPHLVDHVLSCLERTGLPPELLCFEITETALVSDPAAAAAVLTRLRAQGIRFAIDDFGTGYASLSYLTQFPVDMLKIDRSFVRGVETDRHHTAVISAIISLARALDLTVTAEGVETAGQRDALRELGCRNGQGYLWAHPGDIQQMDRLMAAGPL